MQLLAQSPFTELLDDRNTAHCFLPKQAASELVGATEGGEFQYTTTHRARSTETRRFEARELIRRGSTAGQEYSWNAQDASINGRRSSQHVAISDSKVVIDREKFTSSSIQPLVVHANQMHKPATNSSMGR